MKPLKIGLLREERIPTDRRVALLPMQCVEVMQQYHVEIVAQPSDVRCFTNKEYAKAQISLQEDLSDCDILIGIKEVPVHLLIPHKTYLIFSHTIKQQAQNKKLLQAVLQHHIRLIDYEGLTNEQGERIIAFGRYAGIVGAYNGLMMYGMRYKLFELKRAFQCLGFEDLKHELQKVKLPAIKIALTGGGRVAHGAIEILELLAIKQVTPQDFISKIFHAPVYVQLRSADYHTHKTGKEFDKADFYKNPQDYNANFTDYTPFTDLLVAAAYWHPQAPALFTKEQIAEDNFNIKVIADITCDIGGSIPSTIRPSTINNPVYDFNRFTGLLEAPFSDEKNITVMAVDNLPGEIPRLASEGFGIQLINNVLPELLLGKTNGVIQSGIVAEQGQLSRKFSYLKDYILEK